MQDFEINCLKNYNTDLDKAPPPKRGIRGCINGVYLRLVTRNRGNMVGIYTGNRMYHFDGIDVLPLADFSERWHEGQIF